MPPSPSCGSLPAGASDVDGLVRAHLPLVTRIVHEAAARLPSHIHLDDLTSAGLAALAQAARSFCADRGVPFASYASTRIRGALIDELRGIDWASRSVRRRARDIATSRAQLAGALERQPTYAELAEHTGLSVAEITGNEHDVTRAAVISLQGFGENALEDLLSPSGHTPEAQLEHTERLAYLLDAVAELPQRLRVVVEGYFFAERPMAELAQELSVTESRVSQMRAEALALLKDGLNAALAPELVNAPSNPEGCAARRRQAYFSAIASRRHPLARLETNAAVFEAYQTA